MPTVCASKKIDVCEREISWLVVMPVPDNEIFCGLPVASSVIVTVPVTVPVFVGVKVSPIVQALPGESCPTQPLESA